MNIYENFQYYKEKATEYAEKNHRLLNSINKETDKLKKENMELAEKLQQVDLEKWINETANIAYYAKYKLSSFKKFFNALRILQIISVLFMIPLIAKDHFDSLISNDFLISWLMIIATIEIISLYYIIRYWRYKSIEVFDIKYTMYDRKIDFLSKIELIDQKLSESFEMYFDDIFKKISTIEDSKYFYNKKFLNLFAEKSIRNEKIQVPC